MISLFDMYSSIYEKLRVIAENYDNADNRLNAANQNDMASLTLRIENLQNQLKRIDEYSEKVEYFRQLAEKHLESKNLLTITPRELNFNRLRNWAMMIDPTETDDPYAQRIYVQAKCNEMFLQLKKAEFEKTLAELTADPGADNERIAAEVNAIKTELTEQCRVVIESQEFSDFTSELLKQHAQYLNGDQIQLNAKDSVDEDELTGLGGYARLLPVLGELKYIVKSQLGEYYDVVNSSVLLPVEQSLAKETIISVACTSGKEKKLYRGLQNYLLNVISHSPIGSMRIYVLDGLHYNNTSLGALRPLEESIVMNPIPRDSEALLDTLKEIVLSFSDIDEAIGFADSVEEYNSKVEPSERIERKTLVLIGYPSAFSGEAKEYIKRILINYAHYGISVIVADTQYVLKKEEDLHDMPVDIEQGVIRIQMTQQKELMSKNGGPFYHYRWYELKQELPESFVRTIEESSVGTGALGTEYVKRIDMDVVPPYQRGKKSIVLPYGVDQKDQVHSISFDNENFAAYLMGASGSGKSTLLHTLITGIIRDYHPDDVELWLADFKMSEFAQYINPLPPHVKYILLDESPELVYDLLDQLTEKMMERQRFFMKHRDMKKVENVPSSIYMPVIFVILDEFSIMSQAVFESETYKLRLQNLLAKGRALGIKFIFSSQTFTKGIAGLTQTAKDQIQTRIAMKNSYNEINETLELSSGTRTDQVRNWMEALPPHYALSKYREDDTLHVKRLQVMYFKGKGDEALIPQRKLINHLNSTMHAVDIADYDAGVVANYVDKHPVVVDGNSYKAFVKQQIGDVIQSYRSAQTSDMTDEDMVVVWGVPRRMVETKFAIVTKESRENMLLIARGAEQACAMSILLAAMKSFELQKGNVQVWAYGKNRLYRAYRDSEFVNYQVAEGLSEICSAISDLKNKIVQKEAGNDLIIMIGMEQICSDFELIDFSNSNPETASSITTLFKADSFAVSTEEQQKEYEQVLNVEQQLADILEKIEEDGIEEGKSAEEIMQETEKAIEEFMKKQDLLPEDHEDFSQSDVTQNAYPEENEMPDVVSREYNASEDLKYIVRQGSRLGYHFMLCLSDYSDIKSTRLQQEWFRHKLAFQISGDDSISLFASKVASKLPEHICQYSDTLEQYSLRPFIHPGVSWDGWEVDETTGEAINPTIV